LPPQQSNAQSQESLSGDLEDQVNDPSASTSRLKPLDNLLVSILLFALPLLSPFPETVLENCLLIVLINRRIHSVAAFQAASTRA
jgi:hypothetical protein